MRFFFALLLLVSLSAQAGTATPMQFNFSGQLTDSFDSPISNKNVDLKMEILSPSGCLLYEEQQSLLTAADGKFAITIGTLNTSGGYRAGSDPGLSMDAVFSNAGVNRCGETPSAGWARQLRVTIVAVQGVTTNDVLTTKTINAVPYAIAADSANELQGYVPSHFLQVDTSGTLVLSQSNLENIFSGTNYPILTSLLAGTSTLYSKPAANGTSQLPNIAAPTTPTAGQVWYDSGVIKYHDGATTQTVRTAGALAEGDIPTLTTAGKVSGNAINSGTIAGTTAMNTSGNIVTSGNIAAQDISSTGTITGSLIIGSTLSSTIDESRTFRFFEPTGIEYTQIKSPAMAGNVSWTLPATQGAAGTYLHNDGTGILSWTVPAASGVTSFSGRAGAVVPLANDYTWAQIDKSTSSLADITTRSAADLSSGILPDARLSSKVVLEDIANLFTVGGQQITNNDMNAKPLVIRGAASQTASLTEWQNSSGSILYGLDPSGVPVANSDLATKDFVNTSANNRVSKAGDTMTGALVNNTNSASTVLQVTQAGSGHAAHFMGGKVGIGTTNPSEELEVTGDVKVSANIYANVLDINGGTYLSGGNGTIYSSIGPVGAALRIDNNNMADGTFSGLEIRPRNTANNFASIFVGGISSSSYNPAFVVKAQTGAASYAERMRIDGSGNVGLGTTAPVRLLHVNGPMRVQPADLPATPAAGDIAVDDDDSNKLKFYDGSSWLALGAGAGTFTSVTSISNSGGNITLSPIAATGRVEITSTTTSSSPTTGALVVSGGAGIAGNLYSGGSVYVTNNLNVNGNGFVPQLYGSSSSGGDIRIDGTSDATKGDVLLATGGGNVGVGTATPQALLDLYLGSGFDPNFYMRDGDVAHGITAVAPTDTFFKVAPLNTTGGGVKITGMSDHGSVSGMSLFGLIGSVSPSPEIPAITLSGYKSNGSSSTQALANTETLFQILNGPNAVMTTMGSGNVGIGTTNPAHPLDVAGQIQSSGPLATTNSGYGLYQATGTLRLNTFLGNGYGQLGMESNHKLALKVNNSDRMTLLPNGNVGIGTTNPNQLLTVEGAISLRETTGPGSTTGYGKIFVKSSDKQLYFRDEGGSEKILGGSGGVVFPANDLTPGASIAIGSDALTNLPTPANYQSVAIGYQSMGSGAISGGATNNTAVGFGSLKDLTTGSLNTAMGHTSLNRLNTGVDNTAVGAGALFNTTVGQDNVAVGKFAGYDLTNHNGVVAVGSGAMRYHVGDFNTAVGSESLAQPGVGTFNTVVGYNAGYGITTGSKNVVLGVGSTDPITGNNNIIIGFDLEPASLSGSNQLNIGNLLYATGLSESGTLSTGKVGIGVTNPATTLDVNGTLRVLASVEGAAGSVSSAASYTIPDVSRNVRRINLTNATTITLPSISTIPADTAYSLTIRVKQDGTGNRAITWAGGANTIKWDSGSPIPPSPGPNTETIYQFMIIGGETTWYGSMVWKEN